MVFPPSVNICICTLILLFSAITIYGSNCSQDNQYAMYLKSKQKGNFHLTHANFTKLPGLHECQLKVKFDKKYSHFTKKWEKISLEVNISPEDSCLYDIDIFIGDPSGNKAVTVSILHRYRQGHQENCCAPGQKETWPPPPIIQIMILKLSSPRCVISKESVQQN